MVDQIEELQLEMARQNKPRSEEHNALLKMELKEEREKRLQLEGALNKLLNQWESKQHDLLLGKSN